MDMNHVLQPEFIVPTSMQMGEAMLFPFYREALLNPDFEQQHVFLEGWCAILPETAYGDYQSLVGDGEYLYWAGSYDDEDRWTLRKIRIDDMQEVGCLNVSGYTEGFISTAIVGDYVYVAVEDKSDTAVYDPYLFKIDKHNLTLVDVIPYFSKFPSSILTLHVPQMAFSPHTPSISTPSATEASLRVLSFSI